MDGVVGTQDIGLGDGARLTRQLFSHPDKVERLDERLEPAPCTCQATTADTADEQRTRECRTRLRIKQPRRDTPISAQPNGADVRTARLRDEQFEECRRVEVSRQLRMSRTRSLRGPIPSSGFGSGPFQGRGAGVARPSLTS